MCDRLKANDDRQTVFWGGFGGGEDAYDGVVEQGWLIYLMRQATSHQKSLHRHMD